jgi:hypothetical protein
VAWNNANLLYYTSVSEKSETGLAELNIKHWQGSIPFFGGSREESVSSLLPVFSDCYFLGLLLCFQGLQSCISLTIPVESHLPL